MAERLRLSVIWDRAIAILRSESALFVPVAAAFFFGIIAKYWLLRR